jgi:hypothetical protein
MPLDLLALHLLVAVAAQDDRRLLQVITLVVTAGQAPQLCVMPVLLVRLQLAALLTGTAVLVHYIGYIHLQHQAFFQCYLRLYRYIH